MVDLEITYCQPCGHQPLAMEIVNQLLSTYGMPLNRRMSLTLKPADKGVFDVVVDGQLVFSRGKKADFRQSITSRSMWTPSSRCKSKPLLHKPRTATSNQVRIPIITTEPTR